VKVKTLVALVASLGFWVETHAGPGTTAFAFLQIPVGARGVGLGSGGVALADDATMGAVNPAGWAEGVSGEAVLSRTFYWQEVTLDSVAASYQLQPDLRMGMELTGVGYGGLIRMVERSDGTLDRAASGGTFGAQGLALAIRGVWRTQVVVPVKFGLSWRWAQERLDDDLASTWMADVGFIADRIWRDLSGALGASSLSVGASLLRMGPATRGISLPTTLRVGWGLAWTTVPFLIMGDVEWPWLESARFQIGVETWVWRALALRMGYRSGPDRPHPTVGVGFKVEKEAIGYQVDYALEAADVLGGTHRISVGVRFQ